MFGFGILSCLVFLPLAGAGFILALATELFLDMNGG